MTKKIISNRILLTIFLFVQLIYSQETGGVKPEHSNSKKCEGQKTAILNDGTIVEGTLHFGINVRSPIGLSTYFEDANKHRYYFYEIDKVECENGKVMSHKKIKFWRYYFIGVNTLLAYLFLTNYKA